MAKRKKTQTAPTEAAPTIAPAAPPEPDFVWLASMGDPDGKPKRKHECDHRRSRILSVGGVQYEYVGDEDGHRVYRNQTR